MPKEFKKDNLIIFAIDTTNINSAITLPPLKVNCNPKAMATAFAKIVNETQTKAGWVEEHWGEELGSISASNTTGGFFDTDVFPSKGEEAKKMQGNKGFFAGVKTGIQKVSEFAEIAAQAAEGNISIGLKSLGIGNLGTPKTKEKPRLVSNDILSLQTFETRRFSPAYLRFQQYIELFMNNACFYGEDGVPYEIGTILVYYANILYEGHFENFIINEEDEMPYNFNFDWTFKIDKTIIQL